MTWKPTPQTLCRHNLKQSFGENNASNALEEVGVEYDSRTGCAKEVQLLSSQVICMRMQCVFCPPFLTTAHERPRRASAIPASLP